MFLNAVHHSSLAVWENIMPNKIAQSSIFLAASLVGEPAGS